MRDVVKGAPPASRVPWGTLPLAARVYITLVVALGTIWLATSVPTFDDPVMFVSLAVFACVTSVWSRSWCAILARGTAFAKPAT